MCIHLVETLNTRAVVTCMHNPCHNSPAIRCQIIAHTQHQMSRYHTQGCVVDRGDEISSGDRGLPQTPTQNPGLVFYHCKNRAKEGREQVFRCEQMSSV